PQPHAARLRSDEGKRAEWIEDVPVDRRQISERIRRLRFEGKEATLRHPDAVETELFGQPRDIGQSLRPRPGPDMRKKQPRTLACLSAGRQKNRWTGTSKVESRKDGKAHPAPPARKHEPQLNADLGSDPPTCRPPAGAARCRDRRSSSRSRRRSRP